MGTVNLSVKKVPEKLVQRLKERAARHHRSLQGELMSILEESVGEAPITFEELYEEMGVLGLNTPSESVVMIREDRDAR